MERSQAYLTPAAGKRLIGLALVEEKAVLKAAQNGTLLIVMGTTNGYVAQALCEKLGLGPFERAGFLRGAFKGRKKDETPPQTQDFAVVKGELVRGSVFDIAPQMGPGDVILKGANALYLPGREAGVAIGNPAFGTLDPIYRAVMGRRVRAIFPVGLEKRVDSPIQALADFANDPAMKGLRLCPAPGRAYCELDALASLCGVEARLLAAGGILGAEGGVLLGMEGEKDAIEKAESLLKQVRDEAAFGE